MPAGYRRRRQSKIFRDDGCLVAAGALDDAGEFVRYLGGDRGKLVVVDAEQALAARYGIQSIPTVAVFRAGEPVSAFVGATPPPTAASSTPRSNKTTKPQTPPNQAPSACGVLHGAGATGRSRPSGRSRYPTREATPSRRALQVELGSCSPARSQ